MSKKTCAAKSKIKGVHVEACPTSQMVRQCDLVGKEIIHTVKIKVLNLYPMDITVKGKVQGSSPKVIFRELNGTKSQKSWQKKITPSSNNQISNITVNHMEIIENSSASLSGTETVFTEIGIEWLYKRKDDKAKIEFQVST